MEESNFWDDNEHAQKIIHQINNLKSWTVPYKDIQTRFNTIKELIPEVEEAKDEGLLEECKQELHEIDKVLTNLEVKRMLSGELDNKNCYLSINAGAGGTESCDWAQMLSRMYQRWASKKNWKVEIIDQIDGEVAGLKSQTIKISGSFAYGYAKAEKGVHRLVRISPFDSNAKRHTSFASVDVTPEITDDLSIEIRSDEIRVDTYRASGAGGQHVNKTDSAVRMTHIPTGIVVTCQNQRSQLQNRETCLKLLRSKLYEKEVLEREEEIKKLKGEKTDIGWGNQIRSYVFQPYTLVKDTRTGYQVGDIQSVMDGEIEDFIINYLKEFG